MKKLPALRLNGRSNTFESEEQDFAYDPDRPRLLIEGAARWVEVRELAKVIVEVAPDLDEDTVSGFLTRHQPILNVKSGSCAKFTKAVYGGPITPALRSYLRGLQAHSRGDSFSDRKNRMKHLFGLNPRHSFEHY